MANDLDVPLTPDVPVVPAMIASPLESSTQSTTSASARSISGKVYHDVDANGVQGSSEVGIAGRVVYLDMNNNGVRDQFTRTYTATGVPFSFSYDILGGGYTRSISIGNLESAFGAIRDINVALRITTSDGISDLEFKFREPGYSWNWLSNRDTYGTLLDVTFDDEAPTSITNGGGDVTGARQPRDSLSWFDGRQISSSYNLYLRDTQVEGSLLTNTLQSFSIIITFDEPTAITGDSGNYSFSNLPNGNYTVRTEAPAGWTSGPSSYVGAVDGSTGFEGWDFAQRQSWAPILDADVFESNNTSGTATNLGAFQGLKSWTGLTLDGNDDVDWYRFTTQATAQTPSAVTVTPQAGLGELVVELRDAAGTISTQTTANGPVTLALRRSDGTFLPQGEYFLKVSGAGSRAHRPYSLEINAPGKDAFDFVADNGNAATATPFNLANGGVLKLEHLSIDSPTDVDWYRGAISSPAYFGNYARLTFDPSYGDLDLEIYDSTGVNLLNAARGVTDREELRAQYTPPGEYTLKVTSRNGAVVPDYTLEVFFPYGPAGDYLEGTGNNTLATATNLGALQGSNVYSALESKRPGTDPDYYRFSVAATPTGADFVRVDYDPLLGILQGTLRDPNGNDTPLTSSLGLLYAPLPSIQGAYYVWVTPVPGLSTPTIYAMTIQAPRALRPDWSEPNESLATAYALGSVDGTRTWTGLSISNRDVGDYFTFELGARGRAEDDARIEFDQGQGDLDLYLRDSSGNLRGRAVSAMDREQVSLEGLDPGTYTLAVLPRIAGGTNPNYQLTIRQSQLPRPDRFEPGPETMLGTIIGKRVLDDLSLHVADQQDYYRFALANGPAGGGHFVRAEFDRSLGDVQLALYNWATGEVVRESRTVGNVEEISLAGLENGDYELAVYGRYSNTTNPKYKLTFETPKPSGGDWAEFAPGQIDNNELARSRDLGYIRGKQTFFDLSARGEEDWYRFALDQTGQFGDQVIVEYDPALGDVDIELHNAGGRLASSTNTTGREVIDLAGRPSGAYYLRVVPAGGAGNADYSITITGPSGTNTKDRFESNDLMAQATNLGRAQGLQTWGTDDPHRPLSIDRGSDIDWYKFTLTEAAVEGHYASIIFDHQGGDLSLTLYNSAGAVVASSAGVTDEERISLAGLGGVSETSYYLRVSGANGAANPAYQLVINAPGWDWSEDNDTALPSASSSAYPITLTNGRFQRGGLSVDAGDVDWFSFVLPVSAVLGDAARIDFSQSQGDLDLELYTNPAGAPLRFSRTSADGESISLAGLAANSGGSPITYYLKVSGFNNARNPSYTLSISTSVPLVDDGITSYNLGLSQGLNTIGVDDGIHLSIDTPTDTDWFSFQMDSDAGAQNYARIDFNHFAGDLDLELWDQTQRLATSTTSNSFETVSLAGLKARDATGQYNTYRLRVLSDGGATNPLYTVAINAPQPTRSDWAENNGDLATATNLRLVEGKVSISGLSIHDSNDVDLFRFQMAAAGIKGNEVVLTTDSTLGVLDLALLDSGGNELRASRLAAGAQRISLENLPFQSGGAPATYYLKVTPANANTTHPNYRISFNAPQARGDWSEDDVNRGDTRLSAYDLGQLQGLKNYQNLSIHAAGDEDWFKFTLLADAYEGHFVALSSAFVNGDLDIQLYDANGSLIAQPNAQNGATSNDVERLTLGGLIAKDGQTPRVYYLRVFGFANSTNPDYSLIFNTPATATAGDAYEGASGNNTRSQATFLQLGDGVQATTNLSIHAALDQDWYRFRMPTTGIAGNAVWIDFDHTQGNLDLALYRENESTPLATSTGYGDREEISLVGLTGVTVNYYVKVYVPPGSAIATNPNYALSFAVRDITLADRFEENDTAATATNLRTVTGSFQVSGLTIDIADRDWFRFDLAADGGPGRQVSIDFVNAAANLTLKLYAAGDTIHPLRAGDTTNDGEFVSLDGLPKGAYYLHVEPTSSGPYTSYALNFEAPEGYRPDALEGTSGNDVFASAYDLRQVAQLTGRMNPKSQAELNAERQAAYLIQQGLGNDLVPGGNVDQWYQNQGWGVSGQLGDYGVNQANAVASSDWKLAAISAAQNPQLWQQYERYQQAFQSSQQSRLTGFPSPFDASSNPPLSLADQYAFAPLPTSFANGTPQSQAFASNTAPRIQAFSNAQIGALGLFLSASTLKNEKERHRSQQNALFLYMLASVFQSDASSGLAPIAVVDNLSIDRAAAGTTTADVDYFKFQIDRPATEGDFVRIQFDNSTCNLDLYVYDANRNLVASSTSSTNAEEVSLDRFPTGAYYAMVKAADSIKASPYYRLSFSLNQAAAAIRPDWTERGGALTAPVDLRTIEGDRIFSDLNLTAGDEDNFTFTLSANARADHFVKLAFENARGDVDMELYNSSGRFVARSNSVADGETLALIDPATGGTPLPAGAYRLRVFGHAQAANPGYSLVFHAPTTALAADLFENNDSFDTAAKLDAVTGQSQIPRLSITPSLLGQPADQDYFQFTLAATGKPSSYASIDFDVTRGNLELALFNSSRAPVIPTGATTTRIPLAGLAAGTYYLRVRGATASTANEYALNFDAPLPTTMTTTGKDDWTIMVYMTAGDLAPFAADDINELEKVAAALPGTVNIAVLYDQTADARFPRFATKNGAEPAWRGTGWGLVRPDLNTRLIATSFVPASLTNTSLTLDQFERNTGDANTLQDFITWASTNAPANNYGLVLWNHGRGVQGTNFDENDTNPNTFLSIAEIAQALSSSAVPMKFIAFDACLMQMAEVASALSPYTSYVVGSEEIQDTNGYNYSRALGLLANAPGSVTGLQIASSLVASYEVDHQRNPFGADVQSALATDPATMGGLRSALLGFTNGVIAVLNAGGSGAATLQAVLIAARDAAPAFYKRPDYRDLGRFLDEVGARAGAAGFTSIQILAVNARTALSTAVKAKANDFRGASGLSIYLPEPNGPGAAIPDSDYVSQFGGSNAFNVATGWVNLLTRFVQFSPVAASRIDWAEGNDTFIRAFDLHALTGANNRFQGLSIGSLATGQDEDFFRFSILANGGAAHQVAVELTTTQPIRVDLYRAEAPNTVVRFADATAARVTVSLNGLEAGDYLVRIRRGNTGTNAISYTLAIDAPTVARAIGPADDWVWGNDDDVKAKDLGLVSREVVFSGLHLDPSSAFDWDHYRFSTARTDAGSGTGVLVIRNPAQRFISAFIDSADGRSEISFDAGFGDLILSYPTGAGREYRLLIGGYPFQPNFNYQLHFEPYFESSTTILPDAGSFYLLTEGEALSLSAAASVVLRTGLSFTYSWDVNNDGVFGDVAGLNPTLSWNQLVALGFPDGPASRPVRVRVTDSVGGVFDSAPELVLIANAAPTASVVGPVSAVRGQPVVFTLNATDASPADQAAGFSFNIDWDGNGTTDQTVVGPSGTTVSRAFQTLGNNTIRVTATDKDGGVSAAVTSSVSVTSYGLSADPDYPVDPLNPKWLVTYGGTINADVALIAQASGTSVGVQLNGVAETIVAPSGTLSRIVFNGQAGNDIIYVASPNLAVEVNAGDGNDVMALLDGGTQRAVLRGDAGDDKIYLLGSRGGPVDFLGGDGNDQLVVLTASNSNAIRFFGGAGNDLLYVSPANQPTGLLLAGEEGNDTLVGGAGADFLIGGNGFDLLLGGSGSDLLVTGEVQFLADSTATAGVMAEWTSTRSFTQRALNLSGVGSGPRANGNTFLLPKQTLLNDTTVDQVLGQADADWFLYDISRDLVDALTTELKTNIA